MAMQEPVYTGTSFTIRQTSGNRRQIRLQGRALPYRPFTLSGTMRHDLTWYPGNPNGTLQVLGSAEDETTIKGYWKDRFLGAKDLVGSATPATLYDPDVNATIDLLTARELAVEIDAFRREGQMLDVAWGSLRRFGIISKFEQSWHNTHDCEWSLSFVWSSQEGESPAPVIPTEVSVGDLSQNMFSKATDIANTLADSPPVTVVSTVLSKATQRAAAFADLSSEMQDLVMKSVSGVMTPYTVGMRMAGIAHSAKTQWQYLLNDIMDSPTTYSDQTYVGKAAFGNYNIKDPSASSTGGTDAWQQVAIEQWRRELNTNARSFAVQAAQARERFEARVRDEIIEVYKGRGGEDLRDVSTRFYGTPNEWRRLLVFNQLDYSIVEPGQLILIPRITSASSASQLEV